MVLVTEKVLTFEANGETLAGKLTLAEASSRPGLLFLHGAGRSSKDRSSFLASALARHHGLSSFSFDFSGHGESSGSLEDSSLRKRRDEALAAISAADPCLPFTVLGFSMGGHIALELLPLIEIKSLALFYPAVYSPAAFELPFGGGKFSQTIRQPESWRNAEVFEHLKKFKGGFLLVTGENDHVIPPEIPSLLWQCASQAAMRRHLLLAGAPHLLLPEIEKDPDLLGQVCSTIAEFSRV